MKIKATKTPKHIQVTGQKDPRGPDNTITVWIDEDDNLRISVEKPSPRCYEFSHIEEDASKIIIVQSK